MSTPSDDNASESRRPRRPVREPANPPSHVLQQVNGRVLDPGTALVIRGVTPQSTVYVGPRLTISRSVDVGRVLGRLSKVADKLGWELDTADAEREVAGHRRRLGLVRIDIAVKDQEATLAPDGWVVPAMPMHVLVGPPGEGLAHLRQSADADEDGRFEFAAPMTGEVRLWLVPQGTDPATAPPPFVTPPFLI